MPTWLWRALALGAIAVSLAFVVGDLAHNGPGGNFGFDFNPDADGTYRITKVEPGLPAAHARLRIGDRIVLANADVASKLKFFYPSAPDSTLTFIVERAGTENRVTLRSVAPTYTKYEHLAQRSLIEALEAMKAVFFIVAALIVIRRADNASARALATFLIALAFGTVNIWPWYAPAVAVVVIVVRVMAVVLALTQAIRFATIFPHRSRTGARAAIARVNGPAIVAIFIAGALTIAPLVLPSVSMAFEMVVQAFIIVFAVSVVAALAVAFTIGWREAESVDRERIRWIAVSTAIGLGGLIFAIVLQTLGVNEFVWVLFVFTLAAIPIGTAYAILRHRMLDIGFVVNRALVFGTISALVVAAFSLLEFVLGRYVASLGHVQSALLEALLALGIGVSLGRIHARVDSAVDTIFFRDRHRAEAALRRLAREAAYIDDPHVLAERIVASVDRHANAEGSALYVGDGEYYAPLLATLRAARTVKRNDVAIVRMRALGEPVDLDDLSREAGPTTCPGTIAFPMIVRGQLVGVLACGAKRNRETYAPDERATLAELARAAGSAFDTIATLALQRAVDRTLAGEADLDELRRARITFEGRAIS